MGCNPLGKKISQAFGRLQAKVKRRKALKNHEPEDGITYWVAPGKENPIYVTHPSTDSDRPWEPTQIRHESLILPSTHAFSPSGCPPPPASETKEVVEVQFPEPESHDMIPTAHSYYGRNDFHGHHHESGFGSYSYDSPLSGPELADRKREYFYGEYQYYPTPVREGIYDLATNSNRLTTIFSDENPNACTII